MVKHNQKEKRKFSTKEIEQLKSFYEDYQYDFVKREQRRLKKIFGEL